CPPRPLALSPACPVLPCPTTPKPGGTWMACGCPPRARGPAAVSLPPRRCPPPTLWDAIVGQARTHGRVIHGPPRVVYGTLAQGAAALPAAPGSRTSTTYGVERNNLPVRQHACRLGRQVHAFSKELDSLEPPLPLAFALYL
ncbi:MAG TPA: hypothetical protein VIV15_09135, partial [Anaerolineales bacterium]